ncbi:MAG: hypothetical protein KatS3mg119_0323 [Rhodothalassiaceae bacterium]|nr:MAG: hypothetical protein KatS3mg119_0323 [Rhodothalassiaceae bacterium]
MSARLAAAALLLAAVPVLASAPARAGACPPGDDPDPAPRLVAAVKAGLPPAAPEVTVTIRDNRGDTREILARFRPEDAAKDASGWLVLARNGEPVGEKRARKLAEHLAADGPPMSAAGLARYLAGGVVRAEPLTPPDADGRRFWRLAIAPLGAGSVVVKGEDLSESLSAELIVLCAGGRAMVEEARLALIAPRRLSWFVVLKDARGTQRFGRDAEGRTVLLEERLEAVVDPLILPSFRYVYVRIYRDHRYPAS